MYKTQLGAGHQCKVTASLCQVWNVCSHLTGLTDSQCQTACVNKSIWMLTFIEASNQM
jgi:hypothetical protein